MSQVKFDGTPVKLGDKVFIVPPLNLRGVKLVEPQIQVLTEFKPGTNPFTNSEFLEAAKVIVATSMRRNYPDLTDEDLEEMLDLYNIRKLIPIIMGNSGFVTKDPSKLPEGEEQPVGKDSSGIKSIADLLPNSTGPGTT